MLTARLTYRLRLIVAVVLAATAAVSAGVLAVVVSLPTSGFAERFPLTSVSEARAEAAAMVDRPDLSRVEAESRRTLRSRPGDAAAWSRLAWAAEREGRHADMLQALDRSYTAAPFGPDVTAWRLRFAYGHWSALSPELRRLAADELTVSARDRPGLVAQAEADIVDPAGRMAFALTRSNVRMSTKKVAG